MGEVKDLELSKIVGNEVELSEEVGGRVGNILVTRRVLNKMDMPSDKNSICATFESFMLI